ncbi:hypothetical protein [Flaviaesturariibacter terrae]
MNGKTSSDILCDGPSFHIRLCTARKEVTLQGQLALVDGQLIQVAPLAVGGLRKNIRVLSVAEQKELLAAYSKYELDYFASELGIGVINPNNQWVPLKGRYWFLWYFRVGNTAAGVQQPVRIQLFASTVIGGKILTINAPIMADADFAKAGLFVNELMESIVELKK